MFPPSFEYVRAATLDEAVSLLARQPEARPLAGGHSLIPAMRLRLATPPLLVDIGGISELTGVRLEGGILAIGALATHSQIEADGRTRARAEALATAAACIGDVQVRNRGTLGGSLVHADPAADYGAAVLAMGGECVVAGAAGRRTIPIDDWFLGSFSSALGPGELLTEVRLAATGADEVSVYRKFGRRSCDYGMVGVAVRLRRGPDGRCSQARVALGCVAPMPYRARAAEDALVEGSSIDEAAARVCDGIDVLGDAYVPADYRTELARVEAARAIAEAWSRLQTAA